jgi:uncharacterized protein with HEPN domain
MSERDSLLLIEDMLEAANRLSQDFRNSHPEFEWNRIRGFRNRIVHEYFGIDYSIVWTIIESYLDDLIESLSSIIDTTGSSMDN